MADSVSFYFSPEMNKARVSRETKFVVHVELPDFRGTGKLGFEELDADDIGHAFDLAQAWVNGALGRELGSYSAAIRRVMPDGSLMKPVRIISQEYDEVEA
jgi:hypothetical protein